MKLTIFGGTGRTGQRIVRLALAEPHQVAVFARNPTAVASQQPKPQIVHGNVLDPAAVERAVAGQDAVLSALGIKPWTREPVLLDGTRNILTAMEKHGVRRLICESSFGVGDSQHDADWFTNFLIGLMMGRLFEQKARQEELIRQSKVEWVIVRPARLTNGPRTGKYRVDEHLRPGWFGSISRADVAEFMLKQLTDDTWLRKSVTISY
jgi:uncharacterized protein YbjT (DUF2867 family)